MISGGSERRRTVPRGGLILVAVGALLGTLLALTGGSGATPSPPHMEYAFPSPGGRVASPQTQIALRGIPVTPISVVGSESGPHTGQVLRDTDGHGSSFIPNVAFTPGEVVTVKTPPSVRVVGARKGAFRFTVASPATPASCVMYPVSPRVRGGVWQFRSRPGLHPAAIQVNQQSGRTAPGDLFVAPANGPVQTGPMIVSPRGHLVWFKPLGGELWASGFTTQLYHGRWVLTWWEGCNDGGGIDEIFNSHYHQIAVVHASNGLRADLHEFKITPQGTALITATYPVIWPVKTPHGIVRQVVLDGVVQELDIHSCQIYLTCLVLFQWDSLDHISPSAVEVKPRRRSGDYFHINGVQEDSDGSLLIDSRNTWAAYKVSHQTGKVIWTLGGKHSSFTFGPGASFAFQHDARIYAHDSLVTLFDDEGGPPAEASQSRGLKLRLNLKNKTADLVTQYVHTPPLQAFVMGDLQPLPNGDVFIGWGPTGHFSEFTRKGRMLFDAQFAGSGRDLPGVPFPVDGKPARTAVPGGPGELQRNRRLRQLERSHPGRLLAGSGREHPASSAHRGRVSQDRLRDPDGGCQGAIRGRRGAQRQGQGPRPVGDDQGGVGAGAPAVAATLSSADRPTLTGRLWNPPRSQSSP